MDNFTEDDILYVMAEDLYKKQQGDNKIPVGWYSVDVKKRISILKEAIDSKKNIIDTSGYNEIMEKVIIKK